MRIDFRGLCRWRGCLECLVILDRVPVQVQFPRHVQRRAYGLRDEEYLRLKILTCMLPEL